MISRRLLVAGVAAVASGRVTHSRAQPRRPVLHIPVSLVRDHPLVSVTVDGKGPFRLLLDSGNSSATSLSTERAKQAGLRSTGRVASIAGVVGAGERPIFLGRNVVIGGAVLQKDVAFVGDARTGRLLDGLLPAHVLTTRECELDFVVGEVRLYLEGAPDREGFTPLTWFGDGRQILIESYVDGLRAQLQSTPARPAPCCSARSSSPGTDSGADTRGGFQTASGVSRARRRLDRFAGPPSCSAARTLTGPS